MLFVRPSSFVPAVCLAFVLGHAGLLWSAENQPGDKVCRVLADKRLEQPIRTIAGEYSRRGGAKLSLSFLPAAEVNALVREKKTKCDAVFCMAKKKDAKAPVGLLPGATKVAWKHPGGDPVWAAVLTDNDTNTFPECGVGGDAGQDTVG